MTSRSGRPKLWQGSRDIFLYFQWETLISAVGAFFLAALEFQFYKGFWTWARVPFENAPLIVWIGSALLLVAPAIVRKGVSAQKKRLESEDESVRRDQATVTVLKSVVAKRTQRLIPRLKHALAGEGSGDRYLTHFLGELVTFMRGDQHPPMLDSVPQFEAAYYRLVRTGNSTQFDLVGTTNEGKVHRASFSSRGTDEEKYAVEQIRAGKPVFCPDISDPECITENHLDTSRTRSYTAFLSVPVFAGPNVKDETIGMLSINSTVVGSIRESHAEALQHLAWLQSVSEFITESIEKSGDELQRNVGSNT